MDVAAWLEGLGLGQYTRAFAENGVDADVLPHLTVEDLREIGVVAVGHRRKLVDAIAALHARAASATSAMRGSEPPAGETVAHGVINAQHGYVEGHAWAAPGAAGEGGREPPHSALELLD